MNEPHEFNSSNPDNYLLTMDMAFEDACIAMKEAGIHDAKELTVFAWEQTFQYFKKKKRTS